MQKYTSNKIVIIGAGKVGSTIAYTILLNNLISEIVLIDTDRDRAHGEALDINHGILFLKQAIIRDGDYEDCIDANIIIIAAGIPRKPGQTRNDLLVTNAYIIREITKKILKYANDPIILVISNPVDILTYLVQKESGLPPKRIIGSGTILDTGRFCYYISEHCGVDVRNVNAYIIGEHGDNAIPLWNHTYISSTPFSELCEYCIKNCTEADKDKLFEFTRHAGTEVIRLKGSTFYAISLAVSRIVSAIIGNENAVLTVSSVINGNFDIYDVALSLPCIVNRNGIERYLDVKLSQQEMKLLYESQERLKSRLINIE